MSTGAGRLRTSVDTLTFGCLIVRIKELLKDVDHDPADAEALAALVRRLRREGAGPAAE